MLVDLILSYYLISNNPLYPRSPSEPFATHEVRLEVTEDVYGPLFLKLSPYVLGNFEEKPAGRLGAEVEVGLKLKNITLSAYHHSIHSADIYNQAIEIDGFRLKWTFN